MYSDSGSLLVADDKKLRYAVKGIDQNFFLECGADKLFEYLQHQMKPEEVVVSKS